MQISLAVRHGHLSETSQEKLREKVGKINRFSDRLMAIEVVVDLKDEHAPEVEIMVSAARKHDFIAQATADKLFSAVDSAMQKIEQQMKRHKEKVQKKHRGTDQRRSSIPPTDQHDE